MAPPVGEFHNMKKRPREDGEHLEVSSEKMAKTLGDVAVKKSPPTEVGKTRTPVTANDAVKNRPQTNTQPKPKPISPPPIKRTAEAATQAVTPVLFAPRLVAKAPAAYNARHLYLKKIHEQHKRLNDLAAKSEDASVKASALNDTQVIQLAVEEEEHLATHQTSIYSNNIRSRIAALMKMSVKDWSDSRPGQPKRSKEPRSITTGLTPGQDMEILRRLLIKQDGLEEYGYVTNPPTSAQIEAVKLGLEDARGWEQCERCKCRFQVFSQRRDDGALTEGGACKYHPGKQVRGRPTPINDESSRQTKFTCCGEPTGQSRGCTDSDCHVYKVSDPKRLAAVMPFEHTPENAVAVKHSAVAFDCEMGYTVFGMELIRVTAVSWPYGEVTLDVLVKPLGALLDLNSRFSGVTPASYADAVPFSNRSSEEKAKGRLAIVDSPYIARSMLFELIDPKTPLIGHAIENDLNAMRIIHPSVVDTVMLYPHPRGLPVRKALKTLAQEELDRVIQTGANLGHDSKEDAIATGDLVKVAVRRTWAQLKNKGWTFDGDKLIAPDPGQTGFKAAVFK